MAPSCSSAYADTQNDVHLVTEPPLIQPIVQNPPSPPPTVKKAEPTLSTSPSQRRDSKEKTRRCNALVRPSLRDGQKRQARLFWTVIVFLSLVCWWRSGSVQALEDLQERVNKMRRSILVSPLPAGLHFIPASSKHIHVGSSPTSMEEPRLIFPVRGKVAA